MMTLDSRFVLEDARPTMSRQIADRLRDAIIWLDLKPGDTISESDIAAKFGVSRQPVREAFIQLAETGLVRIRPQRPTEVVRISSQSVLDARFVREALEVAIMRRAATHAASIDRAEFDANLALQADAAKAQDFRRFHRLDDNFHRMISLVANVEFAWGIIERQKLQMDRVRYMSLSFGMAHTVAEHHEIIDAIAAGDGDRAEAALRHHLSKIEAVIRDIRASHADYFSDEG